MLSIQNRELYEVWVTERDQNRKNKVVLEHVYRKLGGIVNEESEVYKECNRKIKMFLTNIRTKWIQVNRTNQKFLNKFSSW